MRIPTRLLTALLPLLLAACYDHNNGYGCCGYVPNPPPVGPQASVQFVHASPDAPPVNVLIDGSVAIPNLDYGQGTGEQQIAAGSHTIEVQALTPGSVTTVTGPTTMTLAANTDYVFAAEGPVASISAQTYSHPLAVVGASSSQVQFVNAAPNAGNVAVYLTAPGADLASSTPFGTVAFQAAVGPTQIPSGQYELRVTAAGAPATVLYDSGTIFLEGGTDFVFSAMQNEGPGTATIFVAAVDAVGDSQRLYDVSTPVDVRVVNDSPNAPPLGVIANGNTAAPLAAQRRLWRRERLCAAGGGYRRHRDHPGEQFGRHAARAIVPVWSRQQFHDLRGRPVFWFADVCHTGFHATLCNAGEAALPQRLAIRGPRRCVSGTARHLDRLDRSDLRRGRILERHGFRELRGGRVRADGHAGRQPNTSDRADQHQSQQFGYIHRRFARRGRRRHSTGHRLSRRLQRIAVAPPRRSAVAP